MKGDLTRISFGLQFYPKGLSSVVRVSHDVCIALSAERDEYKSVIPLPYSTNNKKIANTKMSFKFIVLSDGKEIFKSSRNILDSNYKMNEMHETSMKKL